MSLVKNPVVYIDGGTAPPSEPVLALSFFYGDQVNILGDAGKEWDFNDFPPGNGWGTSTPDPVIDLVTIDADLEGYIMAQVFVQNSNETVQFTNWEVIPPAGYIPGTVMVQCVGNCLIINRKNGAAATGDYLIGAVTDGNNLGYITLRLQ